MMSFWSDLSAADPYGYDPPEEYYDEAEEYEIYLDAMYHKMKDEGEYKWQPENL